MTHDPAPLGDAADVMNPRRAMLAGLGGLAAGAFLASTANAGPLTPPPGPISSTPGPEPRIPINQTNTPGNASNLFRITQPGSYYLTGNMQGVSGRNGISIEASNVTIDLMGYALLGVPGSVRGIRTVGTRNDLIIRNGTISNWGSDGISLTIGGSGFNSIIESICASSNGEIGIRANNNATIRSCVSRQNGNAGLSVPSNADISNCQARNNSGIGFSINSESVISHCSASGNATMGFFLGDGCVITNCAASNNQTAGIYLASIGCFVFNNICFSNSSNAGTAAGISVQFNHNRIEGNTCISNNRGIECTGIFNLFTRNTCSNNGVVNWFILSGNKYGPIISAPFNPSVNGNTASGTLGTTDPWANFTY